MGSITSNSNKKTYYTISSGKLVRKAKENEVGTERVNKNGATVSEVFEDGWSGKVVELDSQSHPDYGDTLRITMNDGNEDAVLSCKLDGGYGIQFLKKMTNINYDNEVTLKPYYIEQKDDSGTPTGKFRSFLGIYQGSEKIASSYSKDAPNGLPQLKELKVKGKVVWDNEEQMIFLSAKLEQLKAELAKRPAPINSDLDMTPVTNGPDEDDLPF
jgi:hypothetical protein